MVNWTSRKSLWPEKLFQYSYIAGDMIHKNIIEIGLENSTYSIVSLRKILFFFISNTHFRLAHDDVSYTHSWSTSWDVSFWWSVSNVLPSDKLLWLDMLRCEQIWWACWDTSWNVLQFSSTFYVNHKSHLNMKNKQITTANTFLPIQWKVPPGCLTVWTWSRSKQHSCLRNFFLKNSLSPEFFIYCQA